MAIFKRKGDKGAGPGDGDPPNGGSAPAAGGESDAPLAVSDPDPRKARAFFERAETVHETTNYEYAMRLWLEGLLRDWTNLGAMEKFFASAAAYLQDNPKSKGPSKDQAKAAREAKGPASKFASALLEWGTQPAEWTAGLHAIQEAVKLGIHEHAFWLGERVLRWAQDDKKAKKRDVVALMDALSAAGAFDLAVPAGELACRIDPSDAPLQARVRNLSAEETMSKGGYDRTGDVGGFRKNIRDLGRQRSLEESDRIVKSEETLDRLIADAATEYKSRLSDPSTIQKFARLLMERGKPKDEELAYKVLMQGFKDTSSYRFKQQAGDIRLRSARRKLSEMKRRLEEDPGNTELAAQVAAGTNEIAQAEITEYQERVVNYPTDLALKFELGVRLFRAERYEESIAQLQEAQNAPGKLVETCLYLAQSFEKLGWFDEAEQTYRRALSDEANLTQELLLAARYGLMSALEARARENRDLEAAEESLRLASSIAIQQISYRDVRDRRASLQSLVKELRG